MMGQTKKARCYTNLLLHIPHSSTLFPEDCGYGFKDLDAEERRLIDYYTDELFIPDDALKRIWSLVFPYCRLYCDVERLAKDPLEKRGLGISYHRCLQHEYRSFSTLVSAFRLYAEFHASVAKKMVELAGWPLLIDCHSFSARPNLLNSNPPDIDICIGYNDDATCPSIAVIGDIVHYFESCGYKIGINEPFSNSKTFEVPVDYNSVMIEVNKRLYMNEDTLEKTDGYYKLKNDLQSLYRQLLQVE